MFTLKHALLIQDKKYTSLPKELELFQQLIDDTSAEESKARQMLIERKKELEALAASLNKVMAEKAIVDAAVTESHEALGSVAAILEK